MTIKLIVALDYNNQDQALHLVSQLEPSHCALKVGSEMFTFFGTQFVKQLVDRKFKVFLDLKFHDIPNTVASACKAAAELGVWMMNVHASGGFKMMSTARDVLESYGADRPLLIGVTLLTSFNEQELHSIGINRKLEEQVNLLALLAKNAGLDGVVCSAHETKNIKTLCGSDFITVTPGIRLTTQSKDDQCRIMTPRQAINEGSNYLVIGRPITQSQHPQQVVSKILSEIQ